MQDVADQSLPHIALIQLSKPIRGNKSPTNALLAKWRVLDEIARTTCRKPGPGPQSHTQRGSKNKLA